MAKGKAWRFKEIECLNIHAFLTLLTHKIELRELKEYLRKPKGANDIEL